MSPLVYAVEPQLGVAEFCRVLLESGLGATRPTRDETRIAAMLSGADLVVTARLPDGSLVGVARCITDFAWSCYLAELAVSASAQGLGVGRGLLSEVRRQLGPRVSLTLASMPDAVGFYERVGMERVADAFWFRRSE
ncbi:MAG: family acetyltransferase [Rubritepida sp.]|nr:family acetyltransferase [Rubritepida sp.]